MNYRVRIVDGPAQGFEYETGIEPDRRIAVAPVSGAGLQPGFMRLPLDDDPWPGQREYVRRKQLPVTPDEAITLATVVEAVRVTGGQWEFEDGTLVVEYRLLRPLLGVIMAALEERGWTMQGERMIDPEGNQYATIDGAVSAQTFREIGRAT